MRAIATFTDDKPITGYVLFSDCAECLHTDVWIKLSGFEPFTTHAIHIHEKGNLLQGCKSLGGHWNPTGVNHGSFGGVSRHSGDMINNITANGDGKVSIKYHDPIKDVSELFGRSVVIHSKKDDLGLGKNKESLITGNAGGRMTCAIIGRY